MTKIDRLWIKSMDWCAKYWGCHQIPERSFFVGGYQMPVCARCFGMIAGEIFGIVGALLLAVPFCVCAIILIPMVIDGTLQYKTSYTSNNGKRFATGLLFGFGFSHLIVRGVILILI